MALAATNVFGDCREWKTPADPPQAVVESAAFKVSALLRDEDGVNLTKEEAVAILCAMSADSTNASEALRRIR